MKETWGEYTQYLSLRRGMGHLNRGKALTATTTKKPRSTKWARLFLTAGQCWRQDLGADAAAAGASVLGGLLAVPGGEWAPAASMGLAAGGV